MINRILRDTGQIDEALAALMNASVALASMGRLDRFRHRLGTMTIQTKLKEAGRIGINGLELIALLSAAVSNGEEVLAADDEAGPIAVLLAQLVRDASALGLPVPKKAQPVLDALVARIEDAVAFFITALGRDIPTIADLLALLHGASGQRYSEDLGTDARAAVGTAHRALQKDEILQDSLATILALELTADRAIAQPGWTDSKTPADPPSSASSLASVAREISAGGTNVILAGFASDGSLVRMTVAAGELGKPVREPRALFSRDSLVKWAQRYPFDYGMDPPSNAFDTTTMDLRVSDLPSGRTVLIADTALRSFPPNLLRIAADKAGAYVPPMGVIQAMASAPSLSWLAAARARASLGDKRRVAWISNAATKGGTLAFLADLCSGTLDEHGFKLDRTAQLPEGFVGASMAVPPCQRH